MAFYIHVFVTPVSFDAQLLRNPLEYLHEPYTAWK